MRVICTSDSLVDLPSRLRRFSFTQEENDKFDVTVGRSYDVFGVWRHREWDLYLVHTDTINRIGLWWMPAAIYEVIDKAKPSSWVRRRIGLVYPDIYETFPAFFDPGVADGLEDGDSVAVATFLGKRD